MKKKIHLIETWRGPKRYPRALCGVHNKVLAWKGKSIAMIESVDCKRCLKEWSKEKQDGRAERS